MKEYMNWIYLRCDPSTDWLEYFPQNVIDFLGIYWDEEIQRFELQGNHGQGNYLLLPEILLVLSDSPEWEPLVKGFNKIKNIDKYDGKEGMLVGEVYK